MFLGGGDSLLQRVNLPPLKHNGIAVEREEQLHSENPQGEWLNYQERGINEDDSI